eukprot:TRINITY_DN253_c0_g1_i1.p1 TRINITY_DN253_c0_g1~~TRINITY_DN253_c0_g1_i1.p1  ORF type:complete len:335 (+),score=52.77 TRINITY_DN253_c0_g1_i1:159-1163(+)
MAVVSGINKKEVEEDDLDSVSEWINPFPPNSSRIRNIVNTVITIGLYGLLAWIIYLLYSEYNQDQERPSTSVTYEYPEPQIGLPFPAVVVCNYAGFVPLKLETCTWQTFMYSTNKPPQTKDCSASAHFFEVFDLHFNFSRACIQINTYTDKFYALSADLQNSISFSVDVNLDQYPPNSSIAAVVSVFAENSEGLTLNMPMFYGSRNFAGVGTFTIFSLEKSKTKLMKDAQYKTNYDVTTNVIPLLNKAGEGIVNISISYQELYTQTITQEYSYDLTKFFADVSSYAGTIVDLNLFKIIVIGQVYPFVLYTCFKRRKSRKIFSHVELSQRASFPT